jgi:predicted alpha/beta superfamily hydrolase
VIGNDASVLPDTEVHYLRSEHVGDEFKVLVGHCGSIGAASSPVVFLGDTWANFGTAVEIMRLLRLAKLVPPLLVVGIGYRAATVQENFDLRCRDFTPSVDLTGGVTDATMMGGASRFLAFIADELKPWTRERYGADPDDSAYVGYSLGALFATYVLLDEPATFRRYGIGSASYWWDNEMIFEQEAAYARAHDDLAATVFVSVGAYEDPGGRRRYLQQLPADRRAEAEAEDAADPPADMVAAAERMVTTLRGRAYPSLEIESEVLPGEYHETASPVTLSRSLRYLFDAPR